MTLVVCTSFLGDAVLTTPLIAELARRGPVDLVTTPGSAPLFEGFPGVRRVVAFDKRGADRGVRGLRRVARQVRALDGNDVAYLAQGSHRSGALAWFAGYRRRVGLATSSGRLWYTQRVQPRDGAHHAERLWSLSGGERAPTPGELRPRLFPGDAHRRQVQRLLESGRDGLPLIAVAPGSVWGTKRWPGYPELARAVSTRGRVVVVGADGDRSLARAIRDACPDALDATGALSLLGTAALLGQCRALVTNDSLPLHLASAMATPTIALFGPTVPAFGFGPLAPRHEVIEVGELACRPCSSHGPDQCPLGHFRCMRDLSVEHVVAAVDRLMTEGPRA